MTEEEKLQLCLERDRLLCSPEFTRSPTMSKLLRFLADYKLSEDSRPLTAYAVAVDALGRDDGFDTQADSYPRVQIGRLRRMLDHFYLRENSENRLSIPYQHYEIVLGPNETFSASGSETADIDKNDKRIVDLSAAGRAASTDGAGRRGHIGRFYVPLLLLALLALIVGAVVYLQKPDPISATAISYPAVIVQGAADSVDDESRGRIEAIRSHLVGTLEKFDQIRVFDEDMELADPSQYYLESSILDQTADRVQLRLVDSETREVIWASRISTTSTEQLDAELDRAVVTIASAHGKIAQHERSKYRGEFTAGYPCLLQFHQYLRYRDEEILKPTLACMQESARQFPNDPYLMSMLAIATNISKRQGMTDQIEGVGKDYALMAAKLDQDSAAAAFAVAQSAFFDDDCRRGVAWGKRAVKLNPLNSRIMGFLGTYMLACNMPEGEEYSARALEIDPDVDLAVVATLAMQKLRRGDAKTAQDLASKYMVSVAGGAPGLEITYILASAKLGQKDEARKAWRSLAERSGLQETAAPREVLRKWIANPNLVRELESAFKEARLY